MFIQSVHTRWGPTRMLWLGQHHDKVVSFGMSANVDPFQK